MNIIFTYITLLLTTTLSHYQLNAAEQPLLDFFQPGSDDEKLSQNNQEANTVNKPDIVEEPEGTVPPTSKVVAANIAEEAAATPAPVAAPQPISTPIVSPVAAAEEPQEEALPEASNEQKSISELTTTSTRTPLAITDESVITSTESGKEPSPIIQAAYLGSYLEPWRYGPDETIEFLFENAELSTLISYVEEKFGITFILDDSLKPLPKGGKSIVGSKISFKTHAPLSKKDAWNIFVTFLDMAGLAPVPGPTERVYRLIPSKDPKSPTDASRAPLPTLIGVDASLIPDNDTLIRYVYSVENTTLDAVVATVDMLRSAASPNAVRIPELNAVIITDRGSNIRAMLEIIKELDQPNAQEGLAVIRLERADANKAAKLYADFARQETPQGMAALLRTRKSSTSEYFPRGAKVIAEPRTNSLIVLGTREALEIITEFVRKVIDRADDRPDTPRYVYQLKFLDAENLASVLMESLKFKEDSDAAKSGGVRDGDKLFKQVSIVPEPTTNKLIINADYEDYVKIHELLESIDVEQPQVALRLFLLSVQVTDNVGLGVQMRNKIPGPNGLLGDNVNFQTSGLAEVNSGIVENPDSGIGSGARRLLGNLVQLAASAPVGSTVVTLGSDIFGVWGILNMLQTYSKVNIVSNPFIVTANKYPAIFKLGEIRRVVDSTIFATTSQDAFKDLSAILDINITPQVSSDGLITLDVYFDLQQFDDPNIDSSNGNRSDRKIETTVIVANNEVLALGGLVRESIIEVESRLPVLGSIPILGYLFKNRTQVKDRQSLLVLIQAEILKPIKNNQSARLLTEEKVYDVMAVATDLRESHGMRDPINRTFFGDSNPEVESFIGSFMDKRNVYTVEAVEERAQAKKMAAEAPAIAPNEPIQPCTPRYRRRRRKQSTPPPVTSRSSIAPISENLPKAPLPSDEKTLIDMIDAKRASP